MTVPAREEQLRRLTAGDFDILVVGGGISGAAVARDAARRGFKTALVESSDFATGTSSRSSRLVHGGLRYLEHFEFDLVFEASQERRILLEIAPHMVRPLEFLFPIFDDGRVGKAKLDAGMWLYDALSLFRNIERHQMLDAEEMLTREPTLRSEGLLGGARYFDAQVDDVRLVVATVLAAIEAGATALNRCEVMSIDSTNWPGHHATVRDGETGVDLEVDALAVVNATGAWTEGFLQRTGREAGIHITPSRGTHIHVARERLGHEGAFIFEAPQDGRVMFVLPWRDDLTMIGTTDVFYEGPPDAVCATPEDIAYLIDATNHLLPNAHLTPEDVISAWAGLRPLVAPAEGEDDAGAVSREFDVHEEPRGVFSLSGGKLTSHRHMAEETVDAVEAFLIETGVSRKMKKTDTAKTPLPGAGFRHLDDLMDGVRTRARVHGLDTSTADRLTRAYGTRADRVIDLVQRNGELGQRILDARPHILAEATYAVRNEMALHVSDVLFRRTRIGLETRNQLEEAARRVAFVMAEELGWTEPVIEAEVERAVAVRKPDDAAILELRQGGATP